MVVSIWPICTENWPLPLMYPSRICSEAWIDTRAVLCLRNSSSSSANREFDCPWLSGDDKSESSSSGKGAGRKCWSLEIIPSWLSQYGGELIAVVYWLAVGVLFTTCWMSWSSCLCEKNDLYYTCTCRDWLLIDGKVVQLGETQAVSLRKAFSSTQLQQ